MDKEIYSVSIDELMPLIRERLSAGQSAKFSPRGVSMLPMLRQGRDSVVISPIAGKLNKYDLPLYIRDDGKYILHRIVSVNADTYTCMGDNQFVPEIGVRQDQLIGVVTEFYRDNKRHYTTELGYRVYCCIWYHTRKIRHFYRRGVNWLERHLKRHN